MLTSHCILPLMTSNKMCVCFIGVLKKELGDDRHNHFVATTDVGSLERLSVEEVALRHFLLHGYTEGRPDYFCSLARARAYSHNQILLLALGVHAEGRLWHTLCGLLFYDIFYDFNVPHVWISEFQVCKISPV